MTSYCKHPDSFDCCYCKFHSLGVKHEDLMRISYLFYQDTKKSYGRRGCDRCGGLDEPYMISNILWKAAKREGEKFLCLSCVESTVGELKLNDFKDVPINFGIMGFDCRAYLKFRKTA